MIEFYKVRYHTQPEQVWRRIGTTTGGKLVLQRCFGDWSVGVFAAEGRSAVALKCATLEILSPIYDGAGSLDAPISGDRVVATLNKKSAVFGAKNTIKVMLRPDIAINVPEMLVVEHDGDKYVAVLRKLNKKATGLFTGEITVKRADGVELTCKDAPQLPQPPAGRVLRCYFEGIDNANVDERVNVKKYIGTYVCHSMHKDGNHVVCENPDGQITYCWGEPKCEGSYSVIEEEDQKIFLMWNVITQEVACFILPEGVDMSKNYNHVVIMDAERAGVWQITHDDYAARRIGYPKPDVPAIKIKEAAFMHTRMF